MGPIYTVLNSAKPFPPHSLYIQCSAEPNHFTHTSYIYSAQLSQTISPTLPIYTVLNSAKHFPHTPYIYSAQLSQTFPPHSLYIQCSTRPNHFPNTPYIYSAILEPIQTKPTKAKLNHPFKILGAIKTKPNKLFRQLEAIQTKPSKVK